MTAPARTRRLARLADRDGVFRVLAIDHRDSLRVVLDPEQPETVTPDVLRRIKIDLAGATGGIATGVMLDPAVGMDSTVVGAVPPDVGIIAAVEAQGYLADDSVTHTTLLEDWSARIASSAGADAVKLLSLWSGEQPPAQREVIDAGIADAHAAGLPLVLEPLPRGLPGSGPWVLDWSAVNAESGADLFKLPFPGSAAACRELTAMLPAPWAMLSAGAGFETFRDQLSMAMDAGAAGYIVGRAVWREAAVIDDAERRDAITELVVPRLETLSRIA